MKEHRGAWYLWVWVTRCGVIELNRTVGPWRQCALCRVPFCLCLLLYQAVSAAVMQHIQSGSRARAYGLCLSKYCRLRKRAGVSEKQPTESVIEQSSQTTEGAGSKPGLPRHVIILISVSSVDSINISADKDRTVKNDPDTLCPTSRVQNPQILNPQSDKVKWAAKYLKCENLQPVNVWHFCSADTTTIK